MRIAVVGGTGMVGLGVLRALTAAGDDVVVVHRGKTREPLPAGVRTVLADRNEPGRLAAVVAAARPDAVVDLACYTDADATVTVEACADVPRVVVVSSVNAVGGPFTPPLAEDVAAAPVSEYGRDKRAAEEVFAQAWRSGRSDAVVVRLGPIYRPGCYLDGQLCEDAYWLGHLLAGMPALVADDGEALWNLLHADDAGRAIAALLANDAARATTVLVGSRAPLRWRHYYELMYRHFGVPPRLVSRPAAWWQEQLGEPGLLHEMSRWDQVYDLSRLERLAPGYSERVDHRAALPATAAELADRREVGDPEVAARLAALAGTAPTSGSGVPSPKETL